MPPTWGMASMPTASKGSTSGPGSGLAAAAERGAAVVVMAGRGADLASIWPGPPGAARSVKGSPDWPMGGTVVLKPLALP